MPYFNACYDIYGQHLRVLTDDPLIHAAALEALAGFPPRAAEPEQPLEIIMRAADNIGEVPLRPSESAVLIRRTPTDRVTLPCALYRDGERWLLDFESLGRMSLDTKEGRMEGWLVQPGRFTPDWAANFVLLAAIELLRTRGLYAIHGAALEKEGHGVLIVGASGVGKTTACLSLLRDGYGCLSDDHPLLRADNGKMELLPFPGRLAVTDRTAAWFPELVAAQGTFRQDTRKRSFELEAVAGYCGGGPCRPAILIFPRIVDWPESCLEELPGLRALEELLPQTLLVLDQALAARQFEVMAALTRQVPAYRLHFGEDVTDLPALIDTALAATL